MPPLQAIQLELARRNLHDYVRLFWPAIEVDDFLDNWHVATICEHLEAVTAGQIRRLMINMPPRHMKSLGVNVFWPSWVWATRRPQTSFLFASYAQSLTIRDSVKCRRLIQSSAYADLKQWCEQRWELTGDQNAKERYDNTAGGYRLATSVDGALTGEGGHIIVVDDAHNVQQGESEAERKNVIRWWDEAMSTRLNSMKTGAYVVLGQRVHEDDLYGHILEMAKAQDWTVLCLPARYESGPSRCRCPAIPFDDPRTKDGEPLWKSRFDDSELRALESQMTPYAVASQLQQRPQPREGGMFKPEKLVRVKSLPPAAQLIKGVRYWDKAATEGGGCDSAGVLLYKVAGQPYQWLFADARHGKWSAARRNQIIKATAELDGRAIHVRHEQEPGSGGKESAEITTRELAGWVVTTDRVTGSKVSRAEPLAAQVEAGNVAVLVTDGDNQWVKKMCDEMELFPTGKEKDLVDAGSGAFNYLALPQAGTAGTWRT